MLISVNGSTEYWANIRPCFIYIKTSDYLITVMEEGYLDNDISLVYSNDLIALVQVIEGIVTLNVSTTNNHISLINPNIL